MTEKMKRHLLKDHVATCLTVATILVTGVTVSGAGGEKDSGRSARVAEVPARISVARQGKRRLAEERSMVNSLRGKRDPFRVPPPPRVDSAGDGLEGPLPPGSRGLVIGRIRLEGVVREDASRTMIAVVTDRSNLAYFLRVHDQMYNGVVTGITASSIHFAEERPGIDGRVKTQEVVLKMGSERQEAR